MLAGGASHKRNEYAMGLLVEADPAWLTRINLVNVSSQVVDVAVRRFGASVVCPYYDLSDEKLLNLYRQSQYFLQVGIEEGFGLPYIEAMSEGCSVIAIDQPLTRELLGESAILLPPDDRGRQVAALTELEPRSAADLQDASQKYSWHRFSSDCSELLVAAAERNG
jgi:glycosyltransferase involved in cell wall biosynthesis